MVQTNSAPRAESQTKMTGTGKKRKASKIHDETRTERDDRRKRGHIAPAFECLQDSPTLESLFIPFKFKIQRINLELSPSVSLK